MKKILLADNHSIVRTGIKSLLYNQLQTYSIDEAANEAEIESCIKSNRYHLILLDISIPKIDFVRLMNWINDFAPSTSILVFSMLEEKIYGLRSLQLGAKGYLNKSASDADILFAINRILSGKKYISQELAELLSDNDPGTTRINPFTKLTLREMEILLLLGKGKELVEICDTLQLQYSTVCTFKRRIFDKLKVNNMLTLYKLMLSYNVN